MGYAANVYGLAWAAGSIGSPVTNALYETIGRPTLDPHLYDVLNSRSIGRAYMLQQMTGRRFALDFTVPLVGCYETGVPPMWGALLRACGMQESGADFAWTYALPLGAGNSNFLDGATAGYVDPIDITCQLDTKQVVIADWVGSFTLDMTPPNIPTLAFTGFGRLASATARETITAAPSAGNYPKPVAMLSSLTPTLNINISPIVTGTADAGGSGTSLVDAAGNFIEAGIQPGMSIENATDSSTAIVVTVTATTLTTTTLTGGGDNTFSAGDTYNIGTAIDYTGFTMAGANYAVGNNVGHNAGVGGRGGYHRPHLTRGTAGGVLTIKEPDFTRTTTDDGFDWRRWFEQQSGNRSAHVDASLIHNSGGSGTGNQITASWTGLSGQVARTEAQDGSNYAYVTVPLYQHPTTGGFSLVTA